MNHGKLLLFLCLLAFGKPIASAQICVTLNDRPNGGCFETGCPEFCALAPQNEISRQMPGFLSEYQAGKLVVTGVLPDSPASLAGFQVGDVLLQIDHQHVPLSDTNSLWQERRSHEVELRRGSQVLVKQLRTKSVQSLLASLPTLTNPFKPASLATASASFEPWPFLSGMLVHRDAAAFVVDSVLQNSPAERCGIRPADRILLTDGVTRSNLQYSKERATLTLTLRRKTSDERVSVRFASLPEIFELAAH